MIHARQMKAARALLDWSQRDLADAAKLSSSTIRNLELGEMSPRSATATIIRRVLEECGIEFTEGEGVRRRNDVVKIYQGIDSCDTFFDDVLATVKEKGGEVVCVFKSLVLMTECCSMNKSIGQLAPISTHATIKCILPETLEPIITTPSFQYRIILRQHVGPSSYFVYGNKFAVVLPEPRSNFKFVVFNSLSIAEDYRTYFSNLWDMAPPIFTEYNRAKR